MKNAVTIQIPLAEIPEGAHQPHRLEMKLDAAHARTLQAISEALIANGATIPAGKNGAYIMAFNFIMNEIAEARG